MDVEDWCDRLEYDTEEFRVTKKYVYTYRHTCVSVQVHVHAHTHTHTVDGSVANFTSTHSITLHKTHGPL